MRRKPRCNKFTFLSDSDAIDSARCEYGNLVDVAKLGAEHTVKEVQSTELDRR